MDAITLPLVFVPFGADLAVASAWFQLLTMNVGLSVRDRACLALGGTLGRGVRTANAA
jgi:PIN domain nuclease of toxin-antitoxin system